MTTFYKMYYHIEHFSKKVVRCVLSHKNILTNLDMWGKKSHTVKKSPLPSIYIHNFVVTLSTNFLCIFHIECFWKFYLTKRLMYHHIEILNKKWIGVSYHTAINFEMPPPLVHIYIKFSVPTFYKFLIYHHIEHFWEKPVTLSLITRAFCVNIFENFYLTKLLVYHHIEHFKEKRLGVSCHTDIKCEMPLPLVHIYIKFCCPNILQNVLCIVTQNIFVKVS